MKIVSWNVNGFRAAVRKGFYDWLDASNADVVALQEVRAHRDQISGELAELTRRGWFVHLVEAERRGYSGVGLLSRRDPDAIESSLGRAELDREGRFQLARFGDLTLVNSYFPNGNGTLLPGGKRSNDRVPYKLDYYQALFERLEPLRRNGEVLVMGDFNTAHRPIDLARPKGNKTTSGFLPEERQELGRWLDAGWSDTFRRRHPDAEGHYTWWVQRSGCRERNIGWRIDYVLASPAAEARIEHAFILKDVHGSDHCPVGVTLAPPEPPERVSSSSPAEPA